MIPTLHIQLLCEFLLVLDGKPVTGIDKPRLQSLLAYLVLHRDAPQSRSHLAFLFWPESTDALAHSNLRTLVHRLRQALPHANAYLHGDRHSLQWVPGSQGAPWTLDVLDFECTLAEAKQSEHSGDLAGERRALEQAATLYRGDLLPGCYDEWILPERDRLRQEFLGGLQRLIVVLEQARDYQGAIRAAQRLLRHDPLHEATYCHLMRLYALSGNRVAALRTYHTCATVLERELAAAPGQATREVYEHIMQAKGPDRAHPAPRPALVAGTSLVGRTQEWLALQEAWKDAAAGRPHLLLLSGEAGIGKTRLAEELLTWVARQGNATASTRCYPLQEEIAYAPVAAWLRADAIRPGLANLSNIWLSEVSRLVPNLLEDHSDISPPGPLVERWQQQRLFEALARAILGTGRPLLLLLDDIHWCDRETLTFLHYLLLFNPQAPLLLVATMRSEEVTPEHPLTSWLLTLRRDRLVTECPLAPLDATATALLARQVAGRDLPVSLASVLYQETEGNPLFVVETVRAGVLERQREPLPTHLTSNDEGASTAPLIPATIQAVIAARLAQLSPGARAVVSIAAVIGRSFTFDVLLRASEQDEDALVQTLDEVWQRRIVREQGRDAYDFSHEKLREGAYLALSSARRRLLHRSVLTALQAMDAPAAQLAYHAFHAGLKDLTFHFSIVAGDDALRLGALHEAVASYEQAQHVLVEYESIPDERHSLSLDKVHHLYLQLGRAYELTSEHQKAQGVYEAMLAFARTKHIPTMECAALNHLAMLANWQHLNIERAAALLQQAHQVAEQSGDSVGLAETEWGLAQMNYYLVNAQETLLHGEQALALARSCGQQELVARSLNVLAYAYELLGRLEEVDTHMEEARAVYAALGNRAMEVDCLCLLAYARIFSGRLQEGLEAARSAYASSIEMGNTWGEHYSGLQLTYGLREIGAYSEALEVVRHSLTLAGTLDFPPLLIYSHYISGLVQGTLFALEDACTSLDKAAALNEHIKGIPRSRLFSEIIAATYCLSYALAEEWTQAHEYALQAQEARGDHVPYRWSPTLWYETQALVRAGDIEVAEQGVRRFGELAERGGKMNARDRIAYLQSLAAVTSAQGAINQAIAHLEAAAHLAREIGLPGELWLIKATLAGLYQENGETLQARSALARAAEIVRSLANAIQDRHLRKTFLSAARVQRVLQ
jgi:DNA-binding SARP family transcriptional activator